MRHIMLYLSLLVAPNMTFAGPELATAEPPKNEQLIQKMANIKTVSMDNVMTCVDLIDDAGDLLAKRFNHDLLASTYQLLIKVKEVDANFYIYEGLVTAYKQYKSEFLTVLENITLSQEDKDLISENLDIAVRVQTYGSG